MNPSELFYSTRFVSYGVKCEIASNDPQLLKDAFDVAYRSLLGKVTIIKGTKVHHKILLERTSRSYYRMSKDGERLTYGRSRRKFLKFFDSIIRVSIGESAPKHIFVHAGAVAWKGKGILMPADSFQGKSSLVTELVKAGAEYYSDDFAVLDENGLLHPFARPISMRTRDGSFRTFEIPLDSLNTSEPLSPVPIGTILFTSYKRSSQFKPRMLTNGEGVLELIKYTLTFRADPKRALSVLNSSANSAIIIETMRGEASPFAKTLLKFIDNQVI